MRVAALTLTVALLSGSALAEPTKAPPTPLEHLERGRSAYEELELEAAVAELEKALASPALSTSDRAQAELWLGFARYESGRPDLARAAFGRALVLAPKIEVPKSISPKLARIVEAMRPTEVAATPSLRPRASAPDSEPPASVVTEAPQRSARTLSEAEREAGLVAAGSDRGATRIETERVPEIGVTKEARGPPWAWIGLGVAAVVAGGVVAGVLLANNGDGACGPMGRSGGCVVFDVR